MSHPAIDPDAVARLRARLGSPPDAHGPVPAEGPAGSAGPLAVAGDGGLTAPPLATRGARARAAARRAAGPVVARVRSELDRATAGEVAALRAEVAELRAELARTRAEQEAAIAALEERLADGAPPAG